MTYWNSHGSIAEFNGQWYVFYHCSSQASRYNRRVCVEPIRFNADGSIDEVEMTTQGVRGPLPATQPIDAWRVCCVPQTGGWQKWATVSCPVKAAKGVRALYLVFCGTEEKRVFRRFDPERLFELESFWFASQ